MFCPNCGHDCGDAKFCPECGTNLQGIDPQIDIMSKSKDHHSKNSKQSQPVEPILPSEFNAPPNMHVPKRFSAGRIVCAVIFFILALIMFTGAASASMPVGIVMGVGFALTGLYALFSLRVHRGGRITLWIVLTLLAGFIAGMVSIDLSIAEAASSSSGSSASVSMKEEAKSIDEKTWKIFVESIKYHNQIMKALGSVADGGTAVDAYNYADKADATLGTWSTQYPSSDNEKAQKYTQSASLFTVDVQLEAKDLKKYLDSLKTSDLSNLQNAINTTKQQIDVVISNRADYLRSAGYTEDEITAVASSLDLGDMATPKSPAGVSPLKSSDSKVASRVESKPSPSTSAVTGKASESKAVTSSKSNVQSQNGVIDPDTHGKGKYDKGFKEGREDGEKDGELDGYNEMIGTDNYVRAYTLDGKWGDPDRTEEYAGGYEDGYDEGYNDGYSKGARKAAEELGLDIYHGAGPTESEPASSPHI